MKVLDEEDQQTFRCTLVVFEGIRRRCFNHNLAFHDNVKEFPFVSVLEHLLSWFQLAKTQVPIQVLNSFLFKHLGLLTEKSIAFEKPCQCRYIPWSPVFRLKLQNSFNFLAFIFFFLLRLNGLWSKLFNFQLIESTWLLYLIFVLQHRVFKRVCTTSLNFP